MQLGVPGLVEVEEIGRGGFGVVYRARQPALNRMVAVKVLGTGLDEADRERVAREAWAMGTLSGHPNIVHVFDVGVTPAGAQYITMSYVAQGSLAARDRRRRAAGVERGGQDHHQARRRGGDGAPGRHPPSGHQARERPHVRLRRAAAGRLRHRPGGGAVREGDRPVHRVGRPRRPRGARRQAGGCRRRRVLAGIHPVHDAGRPAGVHRSARRDPGRPLHPHRPRPRARPAAPRRARRRVPGGGAGDGQGAGASGRRRPPSSGASSRRSNAGPGCR